MTTTKITKKTTKTTKQNSKIITKQITLHYILKKFFA